MPLDKSGSKKSVGTNIKTEISSGKSRRQSIAIALDVKRRAKMRRKKADGGPINQDLSAADQNAMQPETYANPFVAHTLGDLATLPQRAIDASQADMKNFGDHSVPLQSTGPALETALNGAGMGMPFAAKGAAGIFGGKLAQTADQTALKMADSYGVSGINPTQIKSLTGWEMGIDRKPRFEIPDYKSSMTNIVTPTSQPTTLKDILNHRELYNAYPDMANIEIRALPPSALENAHYASANANRPEYIGINSGLSATEQRSSLLHELQHAVQEREGFAKGSSPHNFYSKFPEIDSLVSNIGKLEETIKSSPAPLQAELQQQRKSLIERLKVLWTDPAREAAMKSYKNTAGEVEARNVQTRRDMTQSKLMDTPSTSTQDVPDAQQIIDSIPSRVSSSIKFPDKGIMDSESMKLRDRSIARTPEEITSNKDALSRLETARTEGLGAALAKRQKQYDADLAAGRIQSGDKLTYREQQAQLKGKAVADKWLARTAAERAQNTGRVIDDAEPIMGSKSMQPRERNYDDLEKKIGGSVKYAYGGAVKSPNFVGYIHGTSGGRTDNKPMKVAPGSYVVPADILSGLGQGNSHAGAAALQQMFKMGPYDTTLGQSGKFADGGMPGEGVPIVAASGEMVIPPEKIAEIGKGDMDVGHRTLDALIKHVRKSTIAKLKKLPGPKSS